MDNLLSFVQDLPQLWKRKILKSVKEKKGGDTKGVGRSTEHLLHIAKDVPGGSLALDPGHRVIQIWIPKDNLLAPFDLGMANHDMGLLDHDFL